MSLLVTGTGAAPADGPAPAASPAPGDQPAGGSWWRRVRWPLLLGTGVVLVAIAGVLTRAGGNGRALDPDGVAGEGSRAMATLLRDAGVPVQRVPTVAAAVTEANRSGGPVTVFVPRPAQFRAANLRELRIRTDANLVVIAPGAQALAGLAPEATPARGGPVRERRPACDAPAALVAGPAEMGGDTYSLAPSPLGRTVGCYPTGGGVSLVLGAGSGRVTVIGTRRPFTNDALGNDGNAALAMNLLGTGDRLVWLLPRPGEVAQPADDEQGVLDLLPDRLLLALLQVAVAVVLLALWRARRLGGVVAEALPVVVRGTETTEGRARLYRATSARGSSAAALRAGAQRRLATRVGLAPDPPPEALVDAIGARTARSTDQVRELLYGANPPESAGLVRLANDLDHLAEEVRQP